MKYSRKKYISKIFEYRRRRELYRKNYNGEMPIYKTERYILLTKRISQWTKEIKRIEVRKRKIQKIVNAVNELFIVDIRNRSTKKDVVLARMIYFKYGLENGICGTHLLRHIGRRNNDVARYNRTKLNKSFAIIPENKIAYNNFKMVFENKMAHALADSGCGSHGLASQPNEYKTSQPPYGRNVRESNIRQGELLRVPFIRASKQL